MPGFVQIRAMLSSDKHRICSHSQGWAGIEQSQVTDTDTYTQGTLPHA